MIGRSAPSIEAHWLFLSVFTRGRARRRMVLQPPAA